MCFITFHLILVVLQIRTIFDLIRILLRKCLDQVLDPDLNKFSPKLWTKNM
jgi:hypothetical protein